MTVRLEGGCSIQLSYDDSTNILTKPFSVFNYYFQNRTKQEQQVYTMINHDYLVDRDGDHWIRYY